MPGRVRAAVELVAQLRPTGTSQEAVLTELRRVLASGRVRAGTVVPLDQIAAAFGVSRTPVREALKSLIGEGLIRHNHRGGYLVHAPTRDEFVELYTIRSALEQAALASAVPRAGEAERQLVREDPGTAAERSGVRRCRRLGRRGPSLPRSPRGALQDAAVVPAAP